MVSKAYFKDIMCIAVSLADGVGVLLVNRDNGGFMTQSLGQE